MSPLVVVGSILGTILFFAIMAYDVATDGRFAERGIKVEPTKPLYPGWFTPYILNEGFACKRYGHTGTSENLWCPNPDCPSTEDDEITEEIPLSAKRLRREKNGWSRS